jgi:chemotaxis protein MotA
VKTLVIGLLALIALSSAVLRGESSIVFYSLHSMLIVVGGTIVVLFLATPASVLKSLFQSVKSFVKPEESISDYTSNLQGLTANRLSKLNTENPLLVYASELWQQGVDHEMFTVLLSERRREIDLRSFDSVQSLKNLSKYPPALGMTGTVIGMMGLFADLDKNRAAIGQNLSLAMTATFLGLIISNLVISPLADRLQIQQAKNQQLNSHLYEILLLINRGESKTLIEGEIHGRAA